MPGAHLLNRRLQHQEAEAAAASTPLSRSESFASSSPLSASTSMGSNRTTHNLITSSSSVSIRKIPEIRDDFPLLDWLSIGNHLFTFGSLGYFLMNFFRLVIGDNVNSSISSGIANCSFFALGVVFILSSGAYWVDILLFPINWTRRRCYHPLNRESELIEGDDEDENYITVNANNVAHDSASLNGFTSAGLTLHSMTEEEEEKRGMHARKRASIRPMNIALPGAKENRLYEEEGLNASFLQARKSSMEADEDEDDDELYGSNRKRRSLCARRLCPIRLETYCEMLNLSGALLNSASSALPYALVTFKPDRGLTFSSVPIAISLMDFFAMCVWLASSLLVLYVWRRDKIESAEEEWEKKQEEKTGMPRALRKRAEELERIAEDVAKKHGEPVPISASPRFQRSSVPRTWIDPFNLQWWSVISNVGGSVVYWSACCYGISISLAVQKNATKGWHLTPQEVQGWVNLQQKLNFLGDCIYLGCAVCCELVYYYETHREMRKDKSKPVLPTSAFLSPSSSSSQLGSALGNSLLLSRDGDSNVKALNDHLMRRPAPQTSPSSIRINEMSVSRANNHLSSQFAYAADDESMDAMIGAHDDADEQYMAAAALQQAQRAAMAHRAQNTNQANQMAASTFRPDTGAYMAPTFRPQGVVNAQQPVAPKPAAAVVAAAAAAIPVTDASPAIAVAAAAPPVARNTIEEPPEEYLTVGSPFESIYGTQF